MAKKSNNNAAGAAAVTKKQVLEELERVKGPDLSDNIVALGLVSEIVIHTDKVYFAISVDPARAEELEPLRQAAENVVQELPGVSSATVTLTADREAGAAPQGPPPAGPMGGQGTAGIPGVKHIIAIASGKGGVGKSTTAINLALAFQDRSLKVGVLDADIYGPSMPRLLGITGRPQPAQDGILKPMEGYGLKVMSMGFMVEEDTPMIWRGPMVISALTQMLREVAWGELDVLVVDMPPGTGDVPLTLAQTIPMTGAVIICTPQDVALIDARRAIMMYNQLNVSCLGIIENMSYYICPKCGNRDEIFDHGGAESTARELEVPFLGAIPLNARIRQFADAGTPEKTFSQANDEVIAAVEAVAAATAGQISVKAMAEAPQPTLSVE